jgi:nitrate reductase NapAB chaperone NapD
MIAEATMYELFVQLDVPRLQALAGELEIIIKGGERREFQSVYEMLKDIDGTVAVVMSFEAWEQLLSDPVAVSMAHDIEDRAKPYDWARIGGTRILVDFLPDTYRYTEPNLYYVWRNESPFVNGT